MAFLYFPLFLTIYLNLNLRNAIIVLIDHEGMVIYMKKDTLPVLIIGGLIVLVLAFMGISALIEKYTPSDERQNLNEYYNITEDTQVAISLDNNHLDVYGTLIDGEVYLDYELVYDYLNSRFYWDPNENILLYTLPEGIVSVDVGSKEYSISR